MNNALLSLINPSNIEKMLEEAAESYKEARTNPCPMTRYLRTVTSLELWIQASKEAGVTHIPAEFSPEIHQDDIETFFGYTGKSGSPQETLRTAITWLEAALQSGKNMWRWDACSGEDLKYLMHGDIDPERTDYSGITIHNEDSRVHELYHAIKPTRTKLCVRPWTTPVYHNGFPVEFRVFLPETENGKQPAAVANYYTQRALPAEWEPQAKECVTLASKILKAFEKKHGTPQFGCTLDFMIVQTETGITPVFLEAGPYPQASPCAFGDHFHITDGAIALNAI